MLRIMDYIAEKTKGKDLFEKKKVHKSFLYYSGNYTQLQT